MMNLIRGIIGTIAVLLAYQSLASWSANVGKNKSQKQIKIMNKNFVQKEPECCGSPICGG